MARRTSEHEELPERSRDYAHYGEQGLAIPTYGEQEEEPERGVTAVNLGEPAASEARAVLLDVLRQSLARDRQ
jgi:hypothetical protein